MVDLQLPGSIGHTTIWLKRHSLYRGYCGREATEAAVSQLVVEGVGEGFHRNGLKKVCLKVPC